MTTRLFFAALVAFVFAGQSHSSAAQGGATQAAKDEVMKAEQAFFDARTRGDKTAFANLLADEFTWGTTNGRFTTKEQQVATLKAAPNPETGAKPEVRMYGSDAAIVITAATTGTGPRKIVRLWTKRDGRWQIVSHQSYLVPPYPAEK